MFNWFKEYKASGISVSDYLGQLQGGSSSDNNTTTNTTTKSTDIDSSLNDFGISGTGGSNGGKSITMNLDIKNYFSIADKAVGEIERIADLVVGKINDRLRDAVITLG